MQKLKGRTVEQIVSVVMSIIFISAFSTYVQASTASQMTKQEQVAIDAEIALQKEKIRLLELKKFADQKTPFSDEDLARLLMAVGFEDKAVKVAWAVVKKESNGRPLAFNGNRATGDNSYGIFQINMIGDLGQVRRDKYDLTKNADLFDPVVNAEIALAMTKQGEDWSSWKVGSGYNGRDQKAFLSWYSRFPEGVLPK
jgi:hypothetical protein